MDLQGFEAFLTYGIGLCAVLALLSPIFNWRRRGSQTLFLAVAFLAMAGVLWGLREGWPTAGIAGMGVVLVVLLALDALTRGEKKP